MNAMHAPTRLKPKQILFIDEYMKDRNATKAYIRAGYSAKGANKNASALMANHGIRAEIARRIEECSYAAGLNRVALLKRLHDLTLVDRTKFLDPRGGILPPAEWPKEAVDVVISYNAGTGTTAQRITFTSVSADLKWLIEAITPPASKGETPSVNVVPDWEAIKARLIEKGRVINATPTAVG